MCEQNRDQPATEKIHKVTESERALSGALMGGAFGFAGLAIFASATYADKVDPYWLRWGNLASIGSMVALIISLWAGGRAWGDEISTKYFNPQHLQALAGLIGVVLLTVAGGLFAFHLKEEKIETNPLGIHDRLVKIEGELKSQSEAMARLERELKTIRSAPIQPKPTNNTQPIDKKM